ncbi:MAG: hypothetical protein ACOCXA_00025 [Planctomycetota bacterium]
MNTARIYEVTELIEDTDLDGSVLARVELAACMLKAAQELLFAAARDTNNRSAMAYIVEHLDGVIGTGPRTGHAPTVADWIEDLEDGDEDEDED